MEKGVVMEQAKRVLLYFVLCVLSFFGFIGTYSQYKGSAKKITVFNTTDQQLSIARYYRSEKKLTGKKVGRVRVINPDQSITIDRPEYKADEDSMIAFVPSAKKNLLSKKLSIHTFDATPHVQVGYASGDHFYLMKDGDSLKGYNKTEWLARGGKERISRNKGEVDSKKKWVKKTTKKESIKKSKKIKPKKKKKT